MKQKRSGALSLVLAVVLSFGLFGAMPAKAFADTPPGAGDICRIVSTDTGYATLAEALDAVGADDTIELLEDITEAIDIVVPTTLGTASFTIDLNGYDLDLDDQKITVDPTGSLTIVGGGTLTAGKGIQVDNGTLSVNADIVMGSSGIDAFNGATVTVVGNIKTGATGAWANGGSSITVTGNINADYGAYADGDGTVVTVAGNIQVANTGIGAIRGASITANGNISADDTGVNTQGDGAEVTVTGNISAGVFGVDAQGGSTVTVNGDITADVTGVSANGWDGFNDVAARAIVFVNGNVIATIWGVYAWNAEVTIDGTLTTPDAEFVQFWDNATSQSIFKTAAQKDASSTKTGFDQYSYSGDDDITSFIWIKAEPVDPPKPDVPQTGDPTGPLTLSIILALAAFGITGIVLARKRQRSKIS